MKQLFGPVVAACLALSLPAAAGAAVQTAPSAQPDEAVKLAEANAIISIMFPPAERQKTFDKMMNDFTTPFRQNMPKALSSDPGLKAIFDEFIEKAMARQKPLLQKHLPEMFEAMAVAYTHEFSLSELKDVHAFAQTPAGRHYLSRSTALIGDPAVIKANAALIGDSQQMNAVMLTEFKTKLMAYLKAHPDIAAKLAEEEKAK